MCELRGLLPLPMDGDPTLEKEGLPALSGDNKPNPIDDRCASPSDPAPSLPPLRLLALTRLVMLALSPKLGGIDDLRDGGVHGLGKRRYCPVPAELAGVPGW